jgi:hypothetical protein
MGMGMGMGLGWDWDSYFEFSMGMGWDWDWKFCKFSSLVVIYELNTLFLRKTIIQWKSKFFQYSNID